MKEPILIWCEPFDVASTIAPPAADDNVLTAEKLLTAAKAIARPDPYRGAFAVRCNEKMATEARLLGFPVVINDLVPDGYIVALKPGEFGPEVAFIVGPEKKP